MSRFALYWPTCTRVALRARRLFTNDVVVSFHADRHFREPRAYVDTSTERNARNQVPPRSVLNSKTNKNGLRGS